MVFQFQAGDNLRTYLTDTDVRDLSLELTDKIKASGYNPTLAVPILRGGFYIFMFFQEALFLEGERIPYCEVGTSRFDEYGRESSHVKVWGISRLLRRIEELEREYGPQRLLGIDEVYDKGHSYEAILKKLREDSERLSRPMPKIELATGYYKPTRREVGQPPKIYCRETAEWLVFPHELNYIQDLPDNLIREAYGAKTLEYVRKHSKQQLIAAEKLTLPILHHQ